MRKFKLSDQFGVLIRVGAINILMIILLVLTLRLI